MRIRMVSRQFLVDPDSVGFRGFYDINTNVIVVFENRNWRETVVVLCHELVHWFQFRFLFAKTVRNNQYLGTHCSRDFLIKMEKQAYMCSNFVARIMGCYRTYYRTYAEH